jgi:uncharacterized protein YbjT (DUF2867 family)
MILVTGATGTNGSLLVKELRRIGAPVRALTRDAKKAEPLKELGAEVAVGDLEQPDSLAAAMSGVERLFLLSAVSLQIGEQERAAAAAARSAGVRHVVKLSANGADPKSANTVGRLHGQGEEGVKASGLAWTFLRPTFFMQNLLWGAGSIAKEGIFRNNLGKSKAAHVDARDIAAVAARALTDPIPSHANEIYELRGPQALSYDEIAAIFTRVLGRPVKYVDLTDEQYREAMTTSGMPEWLARAIVELAELARSGTAGRTNDLVEKIARRKPTSVEEFLVEHRKAFAPRP